MKCPRDGAELSRHQREGGVETDECGRCGGVWLSTAELEALSRVHVDDPNPPEVDADDVQLSFEMARQDRGAHDPCPVCQDLLDRREYAWGSQVLVDVCPQGDGLWLDAGELERLEGYFARLHREQPSPPLLTRLWASLRGVFGP